MSDVLRRNLGIKKEPVERVGHLGGALQLPEPGQVPAVEQPGNVLTPPNGQLQGQQTEKVKPNPLESVGKVLTNIGKTIAEEPQAQEMLARLGVAIGTSPSGVQSTGARVGQAFLEQRETERVGGLEERQQIIEEEKITLASFDLSRQEGLDEFNIGLQTDRLNLETQIFEQIGIPGAEARGVQAEAALTAANASLTNADARQLEAEVQSARTRLAEKQGDIPTQLSVVRLIHTLASKISDNIIDPRKKTEIYNSEFNRRVADARLTGALPLASVIDPAVTQEQRQQILSDPNAIRGILEGADVGAGPTEVPGTGNVIQPEPTTEELSQNVGQILAGVFPSGPTARGITEKERIAEEQLETKFGERVITETIERRPGTKERFVSQIQEIAPKGSGTSTDPILLFSGSEKHAEVATKLPKGVYHDIDGTLYISDGDGGSIPVTR